MSSHVWPSSGPSEVAPSDLLAPAGPPHLPQQAREPGQVQHSASGPHTPINAPDRPSPADRPGTPLRSALHAWVQGWWAAIMLILGIITASLALTVVVIAVSGLATLPAIAVGVLLLVPGMWGAWALGRVERHRILAFTGIDIGSPPPSSAPRWRMVLGFDEPRLRAIAWAGLHSLWGLIMGTTLLAITGYLTALVALPLYESMLPERGLRLFWFLRVDSTVGLIVTWVIATGLFLLLPWVTRGLARVDVTLAQWLLGVDPARQLAQMSQRVQTLTTSREEAIDSVEAERRRIERDLHDGPQQRLVSIAMGLGMARDALDRDPEMARALLDEAHASSKEAIVEMRQVARGIVPPILTDRGLDAAISALAARSPIPVEVTSRISGRLDPTIEAIAYFCVSEALTNVAKHSGATRTTVEIGTARSLQGDLLAVTVTDDGAGGAVVGAGSGLTGLRQRVASVDGHVHVHSPVGGGTTVAITLPLRNERN